MQRLTGLFALAITLIMSAFFVPVNGREAAAAPPVLALVGGTLVDVTGAEPLSDSILVIAGGKIQAAGGRGAVKVPPGAEIFDVSGATVLPGFINAHVHGAFDAGRLAAWAQAGVTTVLDMGLFSARSVQTTLAMRQGEFNKAEYARIASAGPMITVPGGYGMLYVSSPTEARRQVENLINAGVDLVKTSLEDGYAGRSGLPKLSPEELSAIISTAHARGKRVAVHITQSAYLQKALAAGADIIAHLPYDPADPALMLEMAEKGVRLTPTFTVFRNYGAPVGTCIDNLRHFVRAGGTVALGNDFGGGPGEFEQGIPMYEIQCMTAAGMSPMQIIVAATRHAAWVCGKEGDLGTLEAGKIADVLVIGGDPLHDLQHLLDVQLVVKDGVIIRDSR